MSIRLSNARKNDFDDTSKDVELQIPSLTLSTLLNLVAIGKWVVCGGDAVSNKGFRRAAMFMEQLVYEQSYEKAGPDEVWKDSNEDSYHHPTFPEQSGEAWEALVEYQDEVFAMKLIELGSQLMAEREADRAGSLSERIDQWEHRLLDLQEAAGPEAVLRALMLPQENS